MVSRNYLWATVFGVFSWAWLVFGMPLSARGGSHLPYHIKGDTLSYDDTTKTYQARGNVTISKANRSLHADAVDFNKETSEATAWGGVHFSSGKDWLTGSRIEVNLDAGTGTLYDGTLFIEESHFYIRGDEIRKTGESSYYVKDTGRLTSCDGDAPDWEITGKDLRVTIEGYGTVKHVAFRAKSIPLLYIPFLVFPAKTKRQTGLLLPQVRYSNMNGFEYSQPFFWAISENSDATFYEHYMAHRGLKHGFEYRYVSASGGRGTLFYDFLYDKQVDDGTTATDSSGYHYEGFRGDSENRLNRKRWWFRMKTDLNLPARFKGKLDVDLVSDQDYLREFDSGYSGYKDNNHYFLEEFGRELDDKTDTVRLNQLNLNKSWDQFSLNTDFRWYDDVVTRKHDRDDRTLQNLPIVGFSASKQEIPRTPLYFDLTTSFNHAWRDVGTRGYSMDVYPRVYYPLSLFKYFDFEPSAGFLETLWQVEEYGSASSNDEDRLQSREIYDLKGDLSTEISGVFSLGGKSVDKIRHAVQPRIVYEYIPTLAQDNLPNFVGAVDRKSVVTYSLTNTFTARMIQRDEAVPGEGVEPEGEPASTSPNYRYHEFCRITLSQSYDVHKARHAAPGGGKRRPFSDIEGRLEFRPFQFLDLEGDASWSPYDGRFKSYNSILTVSDKRGNRGLVDYRYTEDRRESVLSKVSVNFFELFSAYWEHEQNLKEGEAIKSVLGLIYKPQCWSFGIRYTHDRTINSREYFFEISLYGLGKHELGSYSPQ